MDRDMNVQIGIYVHIDAEAAKGIAKYFATSWKNDLEAFKEKAIVAIQRAYRKRKADKLANADGLAELEKRRQAAEELRAKEEAIRRKALAEKQAEAERQMARARAVQKEREASAALAKAVSYVSEKRKTN